MAYIVCRCDPASRYPAFFNFTEKCARVWSGSREVSCIFLQKVFCKFMPNMPNKLRVSTVYHILCWIHIWHMFPQLLQDNLNDNYSALNLKSTLFGHTTYIYIVDLELLPSSEPVVSIIFEWTYLNGKSCIVLLKLSSSISPQANLSQTYCHQYHENLFMEPPLNQILREAQTDYLTHCWV